jgi:anaphase-promoting complex subunit 2
MMLGEMWLTRCDADFRSHRPLDIVSTLVSIYDSRDLFIKEVQSLISTRLLELKEGNFDNEVPNTP